MRLLGYVGMGVFYFIAIGGFYNLFKIIWDTIMLKFALGFLLAGLVIHWQMYKRVFSPEKDDSFFIIAIAITFILLLTSILGG